MSLSEWEKITPRLGKIERCAEMVSYYADQIINAAELITSMPKFETRAEDNLKTAHEKIVKALHVLLMKEREDYKPTGEPNGTTTDER